MQQALRPFCWQLYLHWKNFDILLPYVVFYDIKEILLKYHKNIHNSNNKSGRNFINGQDRYPQRHYAVKKN